MAFLTEEDRKYRTPEDICAHLGDEYGKFSGAIVPPIFQNSLFVQPTQVNGVTQNEYGYTRVSNPTIDIAERKIAALEGAEGALCGEAGRLFRRPPAPTPVIDTTGAGDGLTAALAVGLAHGLSAEACAELGMRAAGIVMSSPGAAAKGLSELEGVFA